MNQIEFNAQHEVLLALQHVPSDDAKEMAGIDAQIQANQMQRIQLLKDYEAFSFTALDRELFEKIKSAQVEYLRHLDEVLKLSREVKNKEAYALF